MHDLKMYYALRAQEYEGLYYYKPERQDDLMQLSNILREMYAGKTVLELACGTGYWTKVIADVATAITATDINQEMLDIAQTKDYKIPVHFEKLDIYDLPLERRDVQEVFAGFLWSHIPMELLAGWLLKLRAFTTPGTRFTFIDNNYVEGSSTPINQVDEYGNTYQERFLNDGSRYLVMKNFPDDEEFNELAKVIGAEVKITRLRYYWVLEVWPIN